MIDMKMSVSKLFGILDTVKLPSGEWSIARAEIRFERKGVLGEWATVIWDDMNDTFYVKTNKAIVYEDDVPALKEAIDLMKSANEAMLSKKLLRKAK